MSIRPKISIFGGDGFGATCGGLLLKGIVEGHTKAENKLLQVLQLIGDAHDGHVGGMEEHADAAPLELEDPSRQQCAQGAHEEARAILHGMLLAVQQPYVECQP
eukprot:CAMPEP_0115521336 /NCGR_PEP_ID=MMETSP0271-20121206/79490_1 /TAXON_ID=71861 /ORGANISM="Scrippsiella trochoidea, Strain CCMP3099" /LENGTH=103 /DNA_ID=CAMNT_0002952557 /DNA_START=173 /DNA_END=480 /DNA_ORIENTATION=-